MQGNSGGGGGFVLGYIIGQNPVAAFGLAAIVAAAVGAYKVAEAIDTPSREPLVDSVISQSLEACANANENGILYTKDLKTGLMKVWSTTLEKYDQTKEEKTICVDAALTDFQLDYNIDGIGKNERGEYTVMGLVYTRTDGTQALVVRSDAAPRPYEKYEDKPDAPLSISTTLEELHKMPPEAHQYVLADGTKVAVFLQHDGITQMHGSKKTVNDDGKGWANPEKIDEILSHNYTFGWPLVPSSTTAAAPAPAALTP